MRETFKFFGRDAHWSTFTVYDQDYVVTFAHMEHLQWKAGDKVQLFLNDPTGSCPMEVQATVEAIYKNIDIVFLRLEKPLEEKDVPQRDDALFPGCAYVVCGSSNRSHIMPFSISHGCISTTRPDSLGHIRGDSPSAPGDSGGGCFSVDTGCLIAINLGNDTNNPGKAVLLPVAQLDALRASLPPAKTLCIWPPAS